MKKFLLVLTVSLLTLSMTACGAKETPKEAETPVEETGTEAPKDVADADETQGVLDDYQATLDRYNAIVDKVNADTNLVEMEEVITTISEVSETLDAVTDEINATDELTAEDLTNLKDLIANSEIFIDELQAMLDTYAGKTVITVPLKVDNQTGVELHGYSMSPTNSDSWGGNLLTSPVPDKSTVESTMTITEDTLIWDVLATDVTGETLEFMGLDFSDIDIDAGATVTLSVENDEYMATVE